MVVRSGVSRGAGSCSTGDISRSLQVFVVQQLDTKVGYKQIVSCVVASKGTENGYKSMQIVVTLSIITWCSVLQSTV